jgi:hypothetical protein
MIKVTDIIATDNETSSEIDILSDIEASREAKERIKTEVSAYILERTLEYVGGLKSPISGESWKSSLSPSYKKKKLEEGGTPVANLENTGALLSELTIKETEEGFKIGVFGSKAPIADGHNKLSGKDNFTPQRRFLPDEGQSYKSDIEKGVNEIINDILADEAEVSKSDFDGVETESELYQTLSNLIGVTGKANITRAVLANDKLRRILRDLDLMDLIDAED